MPFLNRFGRHRRNSTKVTPGDSSDGECDLDVFNPFEQFDMGITADGKPTSSFSSGSAYTVVDSPRLTMDDFLQRAPNAVADGRRPEAYRAVTIDPATSRPRENRVTFSSEPELRRVAAANSLHRPHRTEAVTKLDLSERNQKATEEIMNVASQSQSLSKQQIAGQGVSNARPESLLEEETPENSRFSFEYMATDTLQRSLSLGSPKSRSLGTRAMTSAEPSFHRVSAQPIGQDQNASAFSSLRNHSSITSPVPSFQRVAGYKFELEQEPRTRSNIRRAELLSIPSRVSSTITRHPDPPRTTDRITPMVNHVPDPKIKRRVEVAYWRRTSNSIDIEIKKEDPKFRQERMLNAAIKRWSFWGSLNRVGDVGPKRLNLNNVDEMSGNESENSDDEDRTAAFRSIEHADQATRTKILDDHLEQIMEAAKVDIKDAGAQRFVQVMDGEMTRVYSRRGMIESAREEVRISVCSSEPTSEDSWKEKGKEEKTAGKIQTFKDRLMRTKSKRVPEKTKR